MSVSSRKELMAHANHRLEVAWYGPKDDPDNVAIECLDCHEVLVDFDRDAEDIMLTLGGPEETADDDKAFIARVEKALKQDKEAPP